MKQTRPSAQPHRIILSSFRLHTRTCLEPVSACAPAVVSASYNRGTSGRNANEVQKEVEEETSMKLQEYADDIQVPFCLPGLFQASPALGLPERTFT